jgi:hypothetical protein
VTIAGFGDGALNNTGFQMTFGGTLAATNVPFLVALGNFSGTTSGFVGETDKGGAVDNRGIVTPTGDSIPAVTAPAQYMVPLRTPFALTGSATDADGDNLVYSWEQNDRGAAAGTALMSNTKTNGPLFAMFPVSGQISDADSLLYDSPGENHLINDPTRVLPDLQQVLDNNTNADTGSCPTGPIAPPVPQSVTECFAEFLPTSDYGGFAGVNASPLSLHFRITPRDLRGGTNSADTTVLLASGTGPFLVTYPNTAVSLPGGSTQTITWDKAGTDAAPVNATDVKISLSVDDGHTYPYGLANSTPERRLRGGDAPDARHDARAREDRGRRQHLLRRLERELRDHVAVQRLLPADLQLRAELGERRQCGADHVQPRRRPRAWHLRRRLPGLGAVQLHDRRADRVAGADEPGRRQRAAVRPGLEPVHLRLEDAGRLERDVP